jgi:hypothetical protein
MAREEVRDPSTYYSIIDGTFRTQVDQNDPYAVRREWKATDGKTGVKFERVVTALIGFITDISFFEGEYGQQIIISLDKGADGKTPKIALNTASREAEGFMKRLPAIDLAKEVRLRPYSFTDQSDGDEVRGIEVNQEDENGDFKRKIGDFFRDPETKAFLNGFPAPEGDTTDYTKDHWKLYFTKTRIFLADYTKQNIIPKIAVTEHPQGTSQVEAAAPAGEPNPNDIPF